MCKHKFNPLTDAIVVGNTLTGGYIIPPTIQCEKCCQVYSLDSKNDRLVKVEVKE